MVNSGGSGCTTIREPRLSIRSNNEGGGTFLIRFILSLSQQWMCEAITHWYYNIRRKTISFVSFNVKTAYDIILVTNDDVANLVKIHPNRLIGFAGIDIPAPGALEQLDYAITSLNLKGVKIVPPVQKFKISDRKYAPIWNKMIDLNIPLWTHGGHQVSTIGSIAKFGHPMLIDEVAMRSQDLTIIIGHMGAPWFWDTYSVVLRHPNVYVDISAHHHLYSYFPWDAYSKDKIEYKVLFASDHPLVHWKQILPAVKKIQISESFKNSILYENSKKLLKI